MEITVRTTQSRKLLRPSDELNATIVGILAKALQTHDIRLHAVTVLSTHMHLVLSPRDVAQMSSFMKFVNGNISREVGRLHDWPGTLWARRYASIPISEEPAAQVGRLKYLLANGCKEGLVASPHQWPGVQSATALTKGEPLRGVWTDWTSYSRERRKSSDAPLSEFQESLEIELEPLPCFAHLPESAWRREVADLVEAIEDETRIMHRHTGTAPLGGRAVRKAHPHERPRTEDRSPRPRFHAVAREVRRRMTEAYSRFVEAYADASMRLRSGDAKPRFPPDCLPPPLPHVPPIAPS